MVDSKNKAHLKVDYSKINDRDQEFLEEIFNHPDLKPTLEALAKK